MDDNGNNRDDERNNRDDNRPFRDLPIAGVFAMLKVLLSQLSFLHSLPVALTFNNSASLSWRISRRSFS